MAGSKNLMSLALEARRSNERHFKPLPTEIELKAEQTAWKRSSAGAEMWTAARSSIMESFAHIIHASTRPSFWCESQLT
jgi:hypothetical protein